MNGFIRYNGYYMRHVGFQGLFLKCRETTSYKNSFVFPTAFDGIRPCLIAANGPHSEKTCLITTFVNHMLGSFSNINK